MERILLQLKKKKDRHRLEEWLLRSYHILLPHIGRLPQPSPPEEERESLLSRRCSNFNEVHTTGKEEPFRLLFNKEMLTRRLSPPPEPC